MSCWTSRTIEGIFAPTQRSSTLSSIWSTSTKVMQTNLLRCAISFKDLQNLHIRAGAQ